MTENLKAALDGWFGDLAFLGVVVWALLTFFFVPRSCEQLCASCPWDQDGERRLRYWTWRVRTVTLEVLIDAMFVVYCLGRVACDLVLRETTWTLPLLAGFGVLCLRWYLGDLRQLDQVRAKRHEVEAGR